MKAEKRYKLYVDVDVRFTGTGKMLPREISLPDGRKYPIDRVTACCRAASLKAGGTGIRYTCRIMGKETFLWYEENYRWFVESKLPIRYDEMPA